MPHLGLTPAQWGALLEWGFIAFIVLVARSFWLVATETRDSVKDLHDAVIGPKLRPEAGLLARMDRVEGAVFHTHRRRTDATADDREADT